MNRRRNVKSKHQFYYFIVATHFYSPLLQEFCAVYQLASSYVNNKNGSGYTLNFLFHTYSLPESVVQAKSINTFKNRQDQFWPNQAMLYNFEAPLQIGTGILKLLIDDDEDLINEES